MKVVFLKALHVVQDTWNSKSNKTKARDKAIQCHIFAWFMWNTLYDSLTKKRSEEGYELPLRNTG